MPHYYARLRFPTLCLPSHIHYFCPLPTPPHTCTFTRTFCGTGTPFVLERPRTFVTVCCAFPAFGSHVVHAAFRLRWHLTRRLVTHSLIGSLPGWSRYHRQVLRHILQLLFGYDTVAAFIQVYCTPFCAVTIPFSTHAPVFYRCHWLEGFCLFAVMPQHHLSTTSAAACPYLGSVPAPFSHAAVRYRYTPPPPPLAPYIRHSRFTCACRTRTLRFCPHLGAYTFPTPPPQPATAHIPGTVPSPPPTPAPHNTIPALPHPPTPRPGTVAPGRQPLRVWFHA